MNRRASPPARPRAHARPSGFTLLELLVAMGIFTFLGMMAIWFMRQSLDIFYGGTREAAVYDRLDTALPALRSDLASLYVGDRFAPPPPPPTEDAIAAGAEPPPPPPPPAVRLRAGFTTLRDLPAGVLKDTPVYFIAFVVALGEEWTDTQFRRGGESASGSAAVAYTPTTIDSLSPDMAFRPPGGLMEVLWIAVSEDPSYPESLTLYRGFRAPIGDPAASLLDPANYDSLEKVRRVARPVMTGLLHFGALWRRAFSTSWDETDNRAGGTDETAPYVGRIWDSTRGFEPTFALHRGEASRSDDSDDVFPAFVRLEMTLQSEGTFGFTRGDVLLAENVSPADLRIRPQEIDSFFGPSLGRDVLYLKIGTEWMSFDRGSVDVSTRHVRVRRGQRDTTAREHPSGAWIHLGTPVRTELALPTFRDRFAARRSAR